MLSTISKLIEVSSSYWSCDMQACGFELIFEEAAEGGQEEAFAVLPDDCELALLQAALQLLGQAEPSARPQQPGIPILSCSTDSAASAQGTNGTSQSLQLQPILRRKTRDLEYSTCVMLHTFICVGGGNAETVQNGKVSYTYCWTHLAPRFLGTGKLVNDINNIKKCCSSSSGCQGVFRCSIHFLLAEYGCCCSRCRPTAAQYPGQQS